MRATSDHVLHTSIGIPRYRLTGWLAMAVKPEYLWHEIYRENDKQTRLVFGIISGTKVQVIIDDPWISEEVVTKIGNALVENVDMQWRQAVAMQNA